MKRTRIRSGAKRARKPGDMGARVDSVYMDSIHLLPTLNCSVSAFRQCVKFSK